MRSSMLLAVVAALTVGSAASAVPPPNTVNQAGAVVIPRRPAVSPYLALTNRGLYGGVANYYTFVRPYLAQQAFNRQQGAAIQRLEQQAQGPVSPVFSGYAGAPPLVTGHNTWFMNHGPYFGGALAGASQ